VILTELAPQVGTRVRVMARDHKTMVQESAAGAQRMIESLPTTPIFTFITNCAGRMTPFAGSEDGEGIYHIDHMPEGPFLGFFCACELGPFAGVTRSMNWTEVLTCFLPAS
jgi:small ligand-binding sensory domain FIST